MRDSSSSTPASPATPPRRPLQPQEDGSPLVGQRTSSRLALQQSSGAGRYANSPPSTPPNPPSRHFKRDKGKQPLRNHSSNLERAVRPALDGRSSERNPRHSHGLSWSSTTRDSVVDNLLMSLDSFGNPNISPVEQRSYAAPTQRSVYQSSASSPIHSSRRTRGHTHSPSFPPDAAMLIHDSSPSGSHSRTVIAVRGDNTNTNHTTLLRTITPPPRSGGLAKLSSESQVPTLKTTLSLRALDPNRPHGETDFGYSQVLESTRIVFPGGIKATGADRSSTDPQRAGPSVMQRGRPVRSVYSKYEAEGGGGIDGADDDDDNACPDPMVAPGPRKQENPNGTGPVYLNLAPPKSTSLRKTPTNGDLRSANGAFSRGSHQDVRHQATEFVRASNAAPAPPSTVRRDVSPMPEKPNFFKRVFGGGTRSGLPPQTSAQSSGRERSGQRPQSQGDTNTARIRSENTHASQSRPGTTSASHQPPTLNKKPSSFFRRRKKSVSDSLPPPPPLPLPLLPNEIDGAGGDANAQKAETSASASSLYKAVHPFLSNDTGLTKALPVAGKENERPETSESSASDDLDIFHSGYAAPPDASLSMRNPFSRESAAEMARNAPIIGEAPKMKIKKSKHGSRSPVSPTDPTAQIWKHAPVDSMLYKSILQTRQETLAPISSGAVSPVSAIQVSQDEPERPPSRASTGDKIIASKMQPRNEPSRQTSNSSYASATAGDDGWVVTTKSRASAQSKPEAKKSERLFLRPTTSEEMMAKPLPPSPPADMPVGRWSKLSPRIPTSPQVSSVNTPKDSPGNSFYSASSQIRQINTEVPRDTSEPSGVQDTSAYLDEDAEYRERARKIFEGDEEDVLKGEAAAWLGERNTLSSRTLEAYMQLLNFQGKNILAALRILCSHLILRGESQQFDRIITALSARWCQCNSNHGFKAVDVVHTIFYSLILLNTDLHLANIDDKMTRAAYVKNTLPTIRRVASDAAPGAFDDTIKPATHASRLPLPLSNSSPSNPSSPVVTSPSEHDRSSFEEKRPSASKRISLRPGGANKADQEGGTLETSSSSMTLVNSPCEGSMRAWEIEVESVLRSFYNSIRSDPLPLHGFSMSDPLNAQGQGDRSLTLNTLGLRRSGSVVSKTTSESISGKSRPEARSMAMRWPGRTQRVRPKIYTSSTVASSRTSFDDGNSLWTPAPSSAWGSKYSLGKSLTTTSLGSYGQHLSPLSADIKHSIGFANALSRAMVREDGLLADNASSVSVPQGILEDEALTLEGAPWAKEGLVKHKHHKGEAGGKAKDRNWTDCFAVISRGKLTLFAFNKSTKARSLSRARGDNKGARAPSITTARVGGGDWMENAEQLARFVLRQTIASVLPPPGYSKQRAHVWALHLPNGAVHLFHVGTAEIAEEFMTTANYWSARLSKEPLQGGVSNIEYGWSENVINMAALEHQSNDTLGPQPASLAAHRPTHSHSNSTSTIPRPSTQSSIRTSFDASFGDKRARLPGDKVQLAEWVPPTQTLMASQLMEVDQLKALQTYVDHVESELEKHNELKHGIELAFSPRHNNFTKAMANWQRKSEHLLRENVKFRTYVDSLAQAQKAREMISSKRKPSIASSDVPELSRTPSSTNGEHSRPSAGTGADDAPNPATIVGQDDWKEWSPPVPMMARITNV